MSSFTSKSTLDSSKDSDNDLQKQEELHQKCLKTKEKLMQSSPVIRFMMEQLEKAGCKLDPEKHFRCAPCDLSRSGGFAPSHGIILCQNRFLSKQHMEDTLTHELIHAFDQCTTQINWSSCEQLACSEIRAISLSGECRFLKELKRGNFSIAKQHQVFLSWNFLNFASNKRN
jgi:inner membrane protease ATP23